ncbi:DUF4349 domain-containing protein [Pyxidicoccus parkwayensis]|uniref:DUF4349 domain-containing protein n=1 Tax=Pyxidicoccus parkwayensis TaxID=2813578 RepID=A0ABX7P469_9BACT|nr:DUF4349 domain-containing protein [Pyxidicoccus parkwaysis]QSQ25273.1 DUF4349 domain-containing protein [Pyxidicoccus parkwaysis]
MRPLLLVSFFVLAACSSAQPHYRTADGLMGISSEAAGAPGALEASRSIIRSALVELEREDPDKGPGQAVALAKTHGGYAQRITSESATVRVPAEHLDVFLGAVPGLGKVAKQSVTAEDITEAHQDLKVRFANLERVRERYLALLQQAATVEDTLRVEKELERVTAEYESLKARLEGVEQQVALATVSLEFKRPVRPGPVGWVFYGLGKAVKWLFVWD